MKRLRDGSVSFGVAHKGFDDRFELEEEEDCWTDPSVGAFDGAWHPVHLAIKAQPAGERLDTLGALCRLWKQTMNRHCNYSTRHGLPATFHLLNASDLSILRSSTEAHKLHHVYIIQHLQTFLLPLQLLLSNKTSVYCSWRSVRSFRLCNMDVVP